MPPGPSSSPVKRIIAVVGPKGGVGKSTISTNLAVGLTAMGYKVVAVDLDLGAANLHAMFGLRKVQHTLDDFLLNKVKDLNQLVVDTNIGALKIICGGDVPGIASLPYAKKISLIQHLAKLEGDCLLLDLGAGSSFNVVDFIIIAHKTLMVTTPEITSLMNVYSFIKTVAHRRLEIFFRRKKSNDLLDLLEKARDPDANPHLKTMASYFNVARRIDMDLANQAQKILAGFEPLIVVNRVETAADANSGEVIRKLMEQYLDIKSSVVLTIREDKTLKKSAAMMKPVVLEFPKSSFAVDIMKIANLVVA
ncbi:MAG: P-loop NTPase [Deltaproteobacteria bacterium]|nr:P-loop NTPase [Deltaproteobacteria bacterium]